MKLLANLRSLLAPSTEPLVVLGPGGDFTEHLVERDGVLRLERPDRAEVLDHTLQEVPPPTPSIPRRHPRPARHGALVAPP
jgi:hypothetical protein